MDVEWETDTPGSPTDPVPPPIPGGPSPGSSAGMIVPTIGNTAGRTSEALEGAEENILQIKRDGKNTSTTFCRPLIIFRERLGRKVSFVGFLDLSGSPVAHPGNVFVPWLPLAPTMGSALPIKSTMPITAAKRMFLPDNKKPTTALREQRDHQPKNDTTSGRKRMLHHGSLQAL
ncbi:hypothetical protein ZHAS_00016026 [Anopheles sinensis]|uniref:Uncharacterized protein n=1 Tax=Anopheles sinensis TaxID=74873 RepID=A0A084WCL5_ANOSI|nr:hypothetical protein ZHAS_00016026 [Anopheles sinensis]